MEARDRGRMTMELRRNERIELYNLNPKLCCNCGKALDYKIKENKFCSNSCCAIYSNPKRTVVYTCLFCGEQFKRKRNGSTLYCSSSCGKEYRKKFLYEEIEKGVKYSASILRQYMMVKYDSKCQKCGWDEMNPVSKTVCLDLHHIDGNADNNVISNVEILCPNCHSLTPTYKNMNSNSSRTTRNKKV